MPILGECFDDGRGLNWRAIKEMQTADYQPPQLPHKSVAIPAIGHTVQWRVESKLKLLTCRNYRT